MTLQHDSGYSVLLNRPGARAGSTYGYGDSGPSANFDDAANQDIHVYRLVLNGFLLGRESGALPAKRK